MKIYKTFLFSLIFVFLVGCQNEKGTQQIEETQQTEQTQAQSEIESSQITIQGPEQKQIPTEGGQLILSMRMPKTLNPLINEDATVDDILKLVFEPLFTIDTKTLKPVPNLASSYSISEDGKTVYINMRDDILWHDGNKVTAKDVVFSLDVIKSNPQSLYANALNKVASYSSNGSQVVIKYTEPYSFFIYNLCFPVIPSHYYKNGLDINSKQSFQPIGNGSFKYESYRLANELILKKTTSFKGTPYIDSIKVIVTSDQETDLYALERNVINSLSLDFSKWSNLNYKREKLATSITTNDFEYLGFNFDKEIFKNVNFRKAVAYCIPKNEIIQNIYLGNGIETISPINPKSFLAYEEIEKYQYSMENAIQALGKANLTKEMTNFTLLVNLENKERLETAELIKKRLNQMGLNVTIIKKNFDEYKKDLETGNFDMFLAGIDFGILPNYASFLTSSGTGEGGVNYQNFKDAKMDTLVSNMYMATSEQNFLNASYEMQKYFVQTLPVVGIFFKDDILVTDYTIKGEKQPNIYNQFDNIEKWYIEQEVK